MQRNLIVDSNNLLHRAFWVCEKYAKVSVSKMFFTCIKNYIDEHMISEGQVYMVWDHNLIKDGTNYRKTHDSIEYKATRDHERNAEVYRIAEYIRKISKGLGLCNMYPGVLEGDDVIAFLCRELDGHNVIVSVDQDLLQLINHRTDVYEPIKKHVVTQQNFNHHQPVPLSNFIHYKAILGDKSDNIPGIPRVGTKRALQVLKEGIDNLSNDHKDIYNRNIELMDLNIGITKHPEEEYLYREQLKRVTCNREVDKQRVLEICSKIECNDMTNDLIDFFNYTDTINITHLLS